MWHDMRGEEGEEVTKEDQGGSGNRGGRSARSITVVLLAALGEVTRGTGTMYATNFRVITSRAITFRVKN